MPRSLYTKAIFIALALGVASAFTIRAAAPPGSISGTVLDENGKPVAATLKIISLRGARPPAQATSAKDGTFTVFGVAAGTYEICAPTNAKSSYLDPCFWSIPIPVAVANGAAVQGVEVDLQSATSVTIQLNDPTHCLSASTATLPGATAANAVSLAAPLPVAPHLLVGFLTGRGAFLPAAVTSSSSNGRTHTAAIPHDVTVRLQLVGRGITVTDQSGKGVDVQKGAIIPFSQPLSGSLTQFQFSVAPTAP